MKSFHLSGPKFDIAVEKFCLVKFSNFLLGQKFVTVKFLLKNAKFGPSKADFSAAAHLYFQDRKSWITNNSPQIFNIYHD